MRVLLVSPLDPDVPGNLKFLVGGENTYTRMLLINPPAGVEYVHHIQAIRAGEVRYGPFQRLLKMLVKFRVLPLSAGTMDFEVLGRFDLVHCHGYTLRLSRPRYKIPVILGDSIPNRWAISAYFKQHPLRIQTTYFLRRLVHARLRIYDQDLSLGDFQKLVVMSEFAKREHLKIGADPERIEVIYPGLPNRGEQKLRKDGPVRFLFVGVWFERKGGMILWEAYQILRKKLGEKVRLTILGPLPEKLKVESSSSAKATADREKLKVFGIEQQDFVSYNRLVGDFYPAADVLVHVPPKAEGYGLVVEEAMSFGIPVVASRVGTLPEMVVDGETGLLVEPGSVEALAEALERLVLDGDLRRRLGKAARQRFLKYFSLPLMQKKLLQVYKEAAND